MEAKHIEKIQEMIKNHQAACVGRGTCSTPNCCGEDISKVATAEPIGKAVDPTEALKK